MNKRQPLVGVGVVVLNSNRSNLSLDVLLVQRGRAPRVGEWSIPGGRQEWGETVRAVAIREVLEETGIEIEILGLIDVVDSLTPLPGSTDLSHHYTLIDFAARPVGGVLQAGDDAVQARWVPLSELADYHLWDETIRIIHQAARFLA